KPYEFQPCAHHVDPTGTGYPACPDAEYPSPQCVKECSEESYSVTYEGDKRKASQAYTLKVLPSKKPLLFGVLQAIYSVAS
ncbi:unnamed protein product, partial [Choristocarpus tenellus]